MDADCSKTCRTCGEICNNPELTLLPIYQEDSTDAHIIFTSNQYLSDFLFNILKIKIYDGMPQMVCTECHNVMNTIVKFYNQCENAQEKLEKRFKFKVPLSCPKIEFLSVDKFEAVVADVDDKAEPFADENSMEEEPNEDDLVKDETVTFDDLESSTDDDSESTDSEEERYEEPKKRKPAKPRNQSSFEMAAEIGNTNNSLPEIEKVCPKCQHNADSKSELIEHIIVKHPSKKCCICKKAFVCIGACNRHYRDIHVRGSKFKCTTCEIDFVKKVEMREHLYAAHGIPKHECKFCNEKFDSFDKYRYHVNSHKSFVCKQCGKSFAQPTSLRIHEKWHETNKPFLCMICGMSFVYQCYLDRHSQSHSTEKPFKCDICDKAFNYKKSYVYHKKTHAGNIPRPFICEQCGVNFVTRASLQVHMRTHMEEKPFKCDLCDRAFSQKGNLGYHRTAKHGNEQMPSHDVLQGMMAPPEEGISKSKKLPFVCVLCKKGFKLAPSLVKHFKVHSKNRGFRCGDCNSAFKKETELTFHINSVHLKIKPHDCQLCPKKFATSLALTVHMRSHTGEKPYPCPICKVAFGHKKSMEKHIVTHTGVSQGECKCQLCPAEFRTYQALSAHNQLEHKTKEESSSDH